MRIVATICSHYPQRAGNIETIVRSLRSGTVVPDEIIVLNNNQHNNPLQELDGVKYVNSPWNSWTRGKYGAALMSPADYYLLLDDDITVKCRTLECLIAASDHESVIPSIGMILNGDSYMSGERIRPWEISKKIVVDSVIGEMQFLPMVAILRMMRIEPAIRLHFGETFLYEAEDILVGLANKSMVIPMREEDESPQWLNEYGVCLPQIIPNCAQMRDRFTKQALEVLRTMNLPWLSEAPWRNK